MQPGQWMPPGQQAQPNQNVWFGNNYSGYSPSRSVINQQPMNPYPQQMPYQQREPIPQTMNNVLSVMGPESAEEFRVGPNSKVILTDSYRPVVYMKQSDDSGYSETRAFLINEIPLSSVASMGNEPAEVQQIQGATSSVTKEEFDEIKQMLLNVQNSLNMERTTEEGIPSLFITKDEFNEFKKLIEDLVMKND